MSETPASDLFDPPGVVWQPVDRRLATVRLLSLAIGATPVLIGGIVVCLIWPNPWDIVLTALVALFFGWRALLVPRRVRAMKYAIRDRDFFQRQGIMFRHLSMVPYVRIQYVDINVGPLQRAFGLASLTVNTASPTLTATLTGVTPEEAARLRDILTDRARLTGAQAETGR